MKTKLLIMAGLCALSFTVNAQTEKGKKLLGGSLGFTTSKQESLGNTSKVIGFSVAPGMGFFINTNFAIGASVFYNYSKLENIAPSVYTKGTSNTFGIAPFVRQYVNLTPQFKFFAQFEANYGKGTQKNTDAFGNQLSYDSEQFGAALSPGFAFFPNSRIGIEFAFSAIGYSHNKFTDNQGTSAPVKSDNFSFGLTTFEPTIGINYHF